MKKITLFVLSLFSAGYMLAQKAAATGDVITCEDFHITKPLTEIFANNPVDLEKVYGKIESEDREHNRPQKFPYAKKDPANYGNDPATMQTEMGKIPGKAPIKNWAGQTAAGFFPLDPSGAAGPNHYVQMINATTFKIYNKSTGASMLSGTLGNLWSPALAYNDGDPVVLYDKAADRWFLAQFGDNDGAAGNKIHIAISTTNDPTGSYYTYTFTSPAFPDYLKFSVWQDGYYMTSNQAQRVFVFERSQMLAGNAAARAISQTFSPPNAGYFFVPLPGDAGDGVLPPAGTPCPIFAYSDNGWGAGYSDAINIFKVTVNWAATATETIASAGSVPTAAFDGTYDSGWNDCPQPGTTVKLDGIGGILMFRAQWKTWSTYNSVVLNWAVKISATQRSIKWCELRQNQSTGVWSMYQEGIYTPDSDTRWLGSIAMDNNGAIALCYLKSNSTSTYPGLYYTGRRPCDPLGTLPITETVAIAGSGSQTAANRDGDYAETWLDPDGVTFWHTGLYMGAGGSEQTRIYSFQLPTCGAAAPVADFSADKLTPCVGATVNFTDLSTNTPTSWAWSFSPATVTYVGGTSATSQNPKVTFNAAGAYNVTLIATNATGSNTMTKTAYINPITAGSLPLVENFEGATFPPAGWVVNNADAPSIAWGTAGAKGLERRAAAGNTGSTSGCAGIECFNYSTDTTQVDELLSKPVSLVGATAPSMTFKRAYKYYNSATSPNNYHDELRVFVSTDCGATFGSALYYKKGVTLASNGTINTTFTPAVAADWDIDTVNLSPYIGQNIIVKFQVTNRYGNNVYLDDVNINNTAGAVASVSITETTGTNPTCAGSSVTFTATPTNGGTTPTYQWQVNGANVGTNSPTYTTTTLTSGQVVTCIMTSNLAGVTGSPATSNAITMTVTTPAVATFSYTGTPYCQSASNPSPTFSGGGTAGTFTSTAGLVFVSATTGVVNLASSTPGTYTVTNTKPASGGCPAVTATSTITIKATPTVTVPANTSICNGVTVPASAFTSTPAGATFAWTNSNTAIGLAASGAGNVPAFTATNAGATAITGTITVTPTLAGCTGAPATYTITVNPQPTSTFTQSANQCLSGNTFNFTNTGSSGGTITQNWTFAGGTPAGSTAVSPTGITFTTAGTHTITHVVTNAGGCSSTTTSTITIFAGPTSQAVTTTNTGCAASTGTITLGATTGGTGPYTYSVNGSGFTTTTSYSGFAAGSYPVIVKDANGCQFTTTANVSSSSGPSAQAVTTTNSTCGNPNGVLNIGATTGGASPFTFSVNGSAFTTTTVYSGLAAGSYTVIVKDVSGCQFTTNAIVTNTSGPTAQAVTSSNSNCGGSDGTITVGATTGGTAAYTYSVNGSAPSTTTAYTGFTAGTYPVVVTDANGCSFSTSVTVGNTGTTPATPTVSQTGLTLTSSSATGNQWYMNGTLIPGATGQTYTITANGSYTVVVTNGGCSSSASSATVVTNVGIDETGNDPYSLSIYPNPSDGHFTISFNANERSTYRVEIVNALGQLIFRDDLKDFSGSYKKEMSVVEYGQGIYTISLTNSKNETVKKIIVY